ncbi:MAG: hypothetical protein A2044_08270 [Candidatus Firestonebacteria bacterium GWA2_43_8]|nr:MAG: hypothetical protein A2044_08270 [Candidatus Firestonebacteria bacterium GWA2_43_8]
MSRRKGSILVLAMFMMSVILLLGGVMLHIVVSNSMMLNKQSEITKTYWIAKAGISQHLHDLREYYFQNQTKYRYIEYGEGACKVGSATLIGRGFHHTLITAVGYYPKPLTPDEEITASKCALIAEIEMNTPTDYAHFVEMPSGARRYYLSMFGGPVHINGDLNLELSYDPIVFCKPVQEYGPALSVSGRIYTKSPEDGRVWAEQNAIVAAGEGEIGDNWNFVSSNSNDGHSNFTSPYYEYLAKVGEWVIPKGFIDCQKLPNNQVTKTAPDETTYSYYLMEDKGLGAKKILVPQPKDVGYDTYKKLITPEWTIDWDNLAEGKTAYITNECLNGAVPKTNVVNDGNNDSISNFDETNNPYPYSPYEKLGPVFPGSGNWQMSFPSDRDPDYLKYIIFRMDSSAPGMTNDDTSPTPAYLAPYHYYTYPVGFGQNGENSDTPGLMTSYKIDRANHKFVFSYPLVWDLFQFNQAPGQGGAPGGFWRGTRLPYSFPIGYTNNQYGQSIDLRSPRTIATVNFKKLAIRYRNWMVHDTVNYSKKIAIRDNATGVNTIFTEAPDIYAASDTDKVFRYNAANHTIDFAIQQPASSGCICGNTAAHQHGMLPPYNPAYVPAGQGHMMYFTWTDDFPMNISAFIHPKVKVVKLLLDRINENNCPRDPKDPNNKNKYGVIYSKVPLVVYGIPKVPVTIICEEDVYVGPVNSDYLKEQKVDIENAVGETDAYVQAHLIDDDPKAFPVGIIGKKAVWMDFTYVPPTPHPAVGDFTVNTFTRSHKKQMRLNKVMVYSSMYRKDPPAPTHLAIGGAGYNRVRNEVGYFLPANAGQGIIGTIYEAYDDDLIAKMAYPGVVRSYFADANDPVHRPVIYARSFRTNPPPHVPVDMRYTGFRSPSSYESSEDFVNKLKEFLESGGESSLYTPEFAEIISKILGEQ